MGIKSRRKGLEKRKKRGLVAALCVSFCLFSGLAAGCQEETKVVLTAGFKEDEVFRIEGISCMRPEIMVYLTNMQNQYESVYGSRIWESRDGDATLEEKVKEQVLGELAQIKTMVLLAQNRGVLLSEEQQAQIDAAAGEYYGSLGETERTRLNVDEELIRQMYQEYALAQTVYEQIVADVNPEISDDEARTITVQMICLPDAQTAEEVQKSAQEEGADFEALARANSSAENISYSLGKGEMDPAIEQAAFELEKDEISPVIHGQDGYYILKCISTFDQARTQENKERIVEQIRNEAFDREYDTFVEGLVRQLNEELWQTVTMFHDAQITTSDFFSVYDKYMGTP